MEKPATDDTVELRFATLDQIADQLEARYGNVVLAVHRQEPGTLMCKRGDMTTCLGVYRELGWWLKEKWDIVECRDVTEDEI